MHPGNVLFCLDPAEKAVIMRQMGGFVAAIDCRWFSQCLRGLVSVSGSGYVSRGQYIDELVEANIVSASVSG